MKSPDEIAGDMYSDAADACRKGGHAMRLLGTHIPAMLGENSVTRKPMWQRRIVPPEGKLITLISFDEYIRLDPREGLGLNYYMLKNLLLTLGKDGKKALSMIRDVIDNFDQVADRERDEMVEPVQDNGTNQHSGSDNVSPSNHGNSHDYLLGRLKRDHPDLAHQVVMNEMSARKAALIAGIVKPTTTIRTDDVTKAVATLLKHYDKKDVLEALR